MSEERKESGRERAERLQRDFEEAAGELDLRLEPAGSGEPRCIGIAFMAAADIPFDIDDSPEPDSHRDDQAIERLILGHESLTPERYHQGAWRELLTDPHLVVAKEGLIQTHQTVIDDFLASQRFTDFQASYPWKEPRDVQIKNLHITYLGPQLASATYRVIETSANGKVIGGNVTTLVARLESGWRGAVITKGGREEIPPHGSSHQDPGKKPGDPVKC
jgi:hypothetical protein